MTALPAGLSVYNPRTQALSFAPDTGVQIESTGAQSTMRPVLLCFEELAATT